MAVIPTFPTVIHTRVFHSLSTMGYTKLTIRALIQYYAMHTSSSGKAPLLTLVVMVALFAVGALLDLQLGGHIASVQATSTATTTVTVLNTPPNWSVTARELYPSATNTPTNSGTSTIITATAQDNNSERSYLLVCKSSSTPQHLGLPGSSVPTCGGGLADQWAVSASTTDLTPITVVIATDESMPEVNEWYAYICDANPGDPECNDAMYNGTHEAVASATSSPFVVNHRPIISDASDDSPKEPGEQITWTVTVSDFDTTGGNDTVQAHICRQGATFDPLIPACVGGQWATSSFDTANPSGVLTATTTIDIPTQDQEGVDALVYIVDEHGHVATSTWYGSSTEVTVLNVAPYVSTSSIGLFDVWGTTTSDTILNLTEPEGETQNFVVEFVVNDDNGCQGTSSAEITGVDINVYRSDIGGPLGFGCDDINDYDPNTCYTHTATSSWWAPNCYPATYAGADTCSGVGDTTQAWECTFPLWYVADPTDAASPALLAALSWGASARATDNGGPLPIPAPLTGSYSASSTGQADMAQFLSFRATGSPIAYGAWEPNDGTPNHPATTTVFATGNTPLDQYLSGDAMCVGYPVPCSGSNSDTIYVPYQHYATSSSGLNYGAGLGVTTFELSTSTAPTFVNVTIPETDATSSPSNDDTYWGIFVPNTITFAGEYRGQNYIDAVVSDTSEW